MRRNVSVSEISDLVKNCDFVPKRYNVLITVNEENAFGGFEVSSDEDSQPEMDVWQWVIAAGEGSAYKPGDKVMIDLSSIPIIRERDPHNANEIHESMKIIAVDCGDDVFTVIPDNYILGKKAASLDID